MWGFFESRRTPFPSLSASPTHDLCTSPPSCLYSHRLYSQRTTKKYFRFLVPSVYSVPSTFTKFLFIGARRMPFRILLPSLTAASSRRTRPGVEHGSPLPTSLLLLFFFFSFILYLLGSHHPSSHRPGATLPIWYRDEAARVDATVCLLFVAVLQSDSVCRRVSGPNVPTSTPRHRKSSSSSSAASRRWVCSSFLDCDIRS